MIPYCPIRLDLWLAFLMIIFRHNLELGFPCESAGKESACNMGDLNSILRLGRSPGEGKGYPLQYSGLVNSGLWIQSMGSQGVGHDWATFTFTLKLYLLIATKFCPLFIQMQKKKRRKTKNKRCRTRIRRSHFIKDSNHSWNF